MDIKRNIEKVINGIPENVRLVVVSKTRSISEIMEVYNAGHRLLGENKVQELAGKYRQLADDIQWHMVGHLQSNKVKYIAPFVSMIHSVDSLKLLKAINKEALKNNRVVDCLLQVHIAMEESKFGFSENELAGLTETLAIEELTGVRIRGLMGMASFTDDLHQVRMEFRKLAGLFAKLKETVYNNSDSFNELSMGMSGDYMIAVEEGSTIVRIGSHIFGERSYD
jgi:PLP dependent protein